MTGEDKRSYSIWPSRRIRQWTRTMTTYARCARSLILLAVLVCAVDPAHLVGTGQAHAQGVNHLMYERMYLRSALEKCGYNQVQLNQMTHLTNTDMLTLLARDCQENRGAPRTVPTASCADRCFDIFMQCMANSTSYDSQARCAHQNTSCEAACRSR